MIEISYLLACSIGTFLLSTGGVIGYFAAVLCYSAHEQDLQREEANFEFLAIQQARIEHKHIGEAHGAWEGDL